jgi:hypothetical protein
MARIKSEARAATQLYRDMDTEAYRAGENNDCAVKAVAAVCQRPYREVLELMYRLGRKPRQGTPMNIIFSALRQFGYTTVPHQPHRLIQERYPNGGRGYSSITTHHPARLQQVWKDGKRYLFLTPTHILAVIDGANHDWTVGTSKRISTVYEVVKAAIALPHVTQ